MNTGIPISIPMMRNARPTTICGSQRRSAKRYASPSVALAPPYADQTSRTSAHHCSTRRTAATAITAYAAALVRSSRASTSAACREPTGSPMVDMSFATSPNTRPACGSTTACRIVIGTATTASTATIGPKRRTNSVIARSSISPAPSGRSSVVCTRKSVRAMRRESRGMVVGTIAALWRYPVKSLRAEPLQRVRVLEDGVEGDRIAALRVETPTHARAGKPYRGKESRHLHLTADPETAASYAADAGVLLTLERGSRWFDAGAVSLLFDLWVGDVEALVGDKLDPRRWRPNLFVSGAPGFARREAALVGEMLRAGAVTLRVTDTIKRCVTTTYDVETGDPTPGVLACVARERDNVVGVYCEVLGPGETAVGDVLTLVER